MCKHASLREMGNEQFTSGLYFHKIVSLSGMSVFLFCFVLFFSTALLGTPLVIYNINL